MRSIILNVLFFIILITNGLIGRIYGDNIHPDLRKPYKILYPHGKNGESEMDECQSQFSPCNIIQNPFFYPFVIKRLCSCKTNPCPDTFRMKRNLNTVFINNREQLKFCNDLPKCEKVPSILQIGEDNIPISLNCFCPKKRRFWLPMKNSTAHQSSLNLNENDTSSVESVETNKENISSEHVDTNSSLTMTSMNPVLVKFYKCVKMERCKTRICGTLRTDFYGSYQNCTCPFGTLCIPDSDDSIVTINEVLYHNGNGQISSCIKFR